MAKRKKMSTLEFFDYIGINPKIVEDILQEKGKHYRTWCKEESNGKKRTIEAPIGELKKIQKLLLEKIEFIPSQYAHGGVKGRSTKSNALVHRGSKFLVRIDIKDAYPSLTKAMLKEHFRKMNASVGLANILTELVTFRGHLPQGAPTSMAIFNHFLSLAGLDDLFSQVIVEGKHLKYSRYVDDLIFTSSRKIPFQIEAIVTKELKKIGFVVNSKKTLRYSVKNRVLRITGVNLINRKPKVPPKKIRKFRGMIGRAIIDDSVSSAKVFGAVAYVMGIEKRIPNQILTPLIKYLEVRRIKCPPKIKKQIEKQTR